MAVDFPISNVTVIISFITLPYYEHLSVVSNPVDPLNHIMFAQNDENRMELRVLDKAIAKLDAELPPLIFDPGNFGMDCRRIGYINGEKVITEVRAFYRASKAAFVVQSALSFPANHNDFFTPMQRRIDVCQDILTAHRTPRQ